MRATLPRDDLAHALGTLARVVERRNTIPILSNILLDAGNGELRITATDLDIEAETIIAAETASHADTTVPAHMLHDIVRKLPAGSTVTLEADGENRLTLRSGRARFVLNTLPADDFPEIAATKFDVAFRLPANEFGSALAAVDFAISTEETRYYLNGVYMHVAPVDGADMLHFVATDSHRLARLRKAAPQGLSAMPGVIIPRKTALELARLAKDAEGEVEVEISETKARFQLAGVTLTTKLIGGTFPDYQRAIPTANENRARLDRATLAAAADRVSVMSSERSKAAKFSFDADALTIEVRQSESGDAREEIDVAFDGEPMQIGFNAAYLRDALNAIASDAVLIKLADAGSPALFSNPDDDALLVVLMPMRV